MPRIALKNDEASPAQDTSRPRYVATASPVEALCSTILAVQESSPWLTYAQAAAYTGWTVAYLRNLVSAGQIPVHGKPRVRRFRRDELDSFLTDPDAAMRRFRAERNRHGG